MAYQATKSKDGKYRYSVHIEYRIDKEMIDWICSKTGWGMQQALGWVRKQISSHSDYGWYSPFWDDTDKELEWMHVDNKGDSFYLERGEFYEEKKE